MFINEETFVPGKSAEVELKPSQAMRIGAKLRPQCHMSMFHSGKSCALGAMWEGYGNSYGAGGADVHIFSGSVLDYKTRVEVQKLNDHSKLTREEIADWLESQGY
jgi:hypothetical protein